MGRKEDEKVSGVDSKYDERDPLSGATQFRLLFFQPPQHLKHHQQLIIAVIIALTIVSNNVFNNYSLF